MKNSRIYLVTIGETDRLVRASSQAQALMHVARNVARVSVATQDDLVMCLTDGVKVETLVDAGDLDDTPAAAADERTADLFEAAAPAVKLEPAWPFPPKVEKTPAEAAALNRQAQDEKVDGYLAAVAKYNAGQLTNGKAPVSKASPAQRRAGLVARYRDPATGSTWSGRGLKPKWLTVALNDGKQLSDFEV